MKTTTASVQRGSFDKTPNHKGNPDRPMIHCTKVHPQANTDLVKRTNGRGQHDDSSVGPLKSKLEQNMALKRWHVDDIDTTA